jgi:hypothetical protein
MFQFPLNSGQAADSLPIANRDLRRLSALCDFS